jgi:hypothetical protein
MTNENWFVSKIIHWWKFKPRNLKFFLNPIITKLKIIQSTLMFSASILLSILFFTFFLFRFLQKKSQTTKESQLLCEDCWNSIFSFLIFPQDHHTLCLVNKEFKNLIYSNNQHWNQKTINSKKNCEILLNCERFFFTRNKSSNQHNLTNLIIENEVTDENIMRLIEKFPNIENLTLKNLSEDVDLELFKVCTKIKILKLMNLPKLENSSFRRLTKDLKLKELLICSMPLISEKGFFWIQQMKELESVSIQYCWEINDDCYQLLPKSLIFLRIEGQNLNNSKFLQVVNEWSLKFLSIVKCQQINPQTMVKLKKMKSSTFKLQYTNNEEEFTQPKLLLKQNSLYKVRKIQKETISDSD